MPKYTPEIFEPVTVAASLVLSPAPAKTEPPAGIVKATLTGDGVGVGTGVGVGVGVGVGTGVGTGVGDGEGEGDGTGVGVGVGAEEVWVQLTLNGEKIESPVLV